MHNGINITVPTAVLHGLKSRILSLPHVVYELGFKCILDRDGWEGIYKFDPATNTTVKVPFTLSGQAPLPIPKGCKVWHEPVQNPREISGG